MDSQVKLILSGSYVSAMNRLTAADQPLHGRKTGTLRFSPFSYLDTACFFPEYSARDRLITFAAFGGLPGHLALVDPTRPVAENAWTEDSSEQIDVVCVGPGGQLLLGECKWGDFGQEDLRTLERRRDPILKEMSGITRVHLGAFVSKRLTDKTVEDRVANGDLILFTIDDLFQDR